MSSGTNQERITQNNAKLAQLKIKADNLPEYQDPTDATYAELFTIADNIYNLSVPDDSATANFTTNDEQVCLQRALKILRGGI